MILYIHGSRFCQLGFFFASVLVASWTLIWNQSMSITSWDWRSLQFSTLTAGRWRFSGIFSRQLYGSCIQWRIFLERDVFPHRYCLAQLSCLVKCKLVHIICNLCIRLWNCMWQLELLRSQLSACECDAVSNMHVARPTLIVTGTARRYACNIVLLHAANQKGGPEAERRVWFTTKRYRVV